MKNKFGFTLAEVLITLVIIGVVAALTIPTAINKYKEQEIESRLKKAYSTFANGIKLSEIQNGPFSSWSIGAEITNTRDYFNKYFKPFFIDAKLCSNSLDCGYKENLNASKWQDMGWGVKTSSSRLLFRLGDGTVIFYPISTTDSGDNISYVDFFYIDVNGTKEPNTYCKDVFKFNKKYVKGVIEPMECAVEHFKKSRI